MGLDSKKSLNKKSGANNNKMRSFLSFIFAALFLFSGETPASASSPAITSVMTNPLVVYQGMSVTFTVNGTSFQDGLTLSFSTTDVTVSTPIVNSSKTQVIATLTVSNTATPSTLDLTLTNPDTGSAVFPSALSIQQAVPLNILLNPASVGQGAVSKMVAVTGTGFQCGMQMTSSDPKITTPNDSVSTKFKNQCPGGVISSNVRFFSTSDVFVYLNVNNTIVPGNVILTFTNPNGTSGTANLTINPAPAITSPIITNPAPLVAGTTFGLTINGKYMQSGAVLSFSGKGISVKVDAVDAVDPVDPTITQAFASGSLSDTAIPGWVDLTLTNPDGGWVTKTAAFQIPLKLGVKTPLLTVYDDPRQVNGGYGSYHRVWNGTWSDEGVFSSSLTGGNRLDMEIKAHPSLFQQMMGRMVYPRFEFQVWEQGGWSHSFVSGKSAYSFGRETFDLAYESLSGNGLVVYGTTAGVYYRRFFQEVPANCDLTLTGNSAPPCWGPETLMTNTGIPVTAYLSRVKLVSNPAKDEILMVYEDSAGSTTCNVNPANCSKLYIRQWNGAAFSTLVVKPSTKLYPGSSVFDAVYYYNPVSRQMQAMVAWVEVIDGTPKSCLWDSVNNVCNLTVPAPVQSGSTAITNLFQLQLSADPDSGKIALGALQKISALIGTLRVQIWDGTAWPLAGSYPATDLMGLYSLSAAVLPAASGEDWTVFNLIWKTGSPESSLFAIYTNSGGGLNYQTWTPDAGWDGDQSIPGIPTQDPLTVSVFPYYINAIRFDSDPRSGDIFGGMKTEYDSIFSTIRWDGASWVDYQQLNEGDYTSFKTPFGFSYFKNFPTIDRATLRITDPATGFDIIPQQGSLIKIAVSGTFFQSGAVLSIPGFTPTTQSNVSGNTITATGTIASDAIPGSYYLTITNPDGSLAVEEKLIQIIPLSSHPPTIYSVSPDSKGQGAVDQTLTLYGYNFPASFSISFSGNGTDIIVKSPPKLLSSGKVSIQVDVDPNAPAGKKRDVIITDNAPPFQRSPSLNLFTVNYGPSITGVTPGNIMQGTAQASILISGNNFQSDAQVTFSDGAFSLGWNSSGSIQSNLYQNKMTGNRFSLSSAVVLDAIRVKAVFVGPSNQLNGQVAIFDDSNNGMPGNLMVTGKIQALTSAGSSGGVNVFRFSLNPPIILPAPANYWVLFNVEGAQTIIPYDDNVSSCNGDTIAFACTAVSKSQDFGSWPNPGDSLTWDTSYTGRRYAISLGYYPIIGSPEFGTPSLGAGSYKDQMTGTPLTVDATSRISFLYAYAGSVDSANPSANMAIYTDSLGLPGSLLTLGRNIFNNKLAPNSYNLFQVPRVGGVTFTLNPGTYWAAANVGGAGTTLTSSTGVSETSVQSPLIYGSAWPDPFPDPPAVTYPGTRYSFFAAKGGVLLGSTTAAVTEGPDSNQMTGSKFTATNTSNLVGISYYVNEVDPVNSSGSAAIYDDNGGAPGGLKVASVSQTLKAHTFNTFTVPITTLSPGKYWVLANVAGKGTTLSYDEGTLVDSVKKANLFSNPWPSSGGFSTTWDTSYMGRRYAISVIPDVMIDASTGITENLITGTVTVDPTATPVVAREICVINRSDDGKYCVTYDPFNPDQPLFQVRAVDPSNSAAIAYGKSGVSNAVSRKWRGYAPWTDESASAVSTGGAPAWSVLRAYPNILSNSRPNENILGTLSNTLVVFQVSNSNGTWGNSFTATPSAKGSRSFDLAYETVRGRGVAVYGILGNAKPQFTMTDGTSWSTPLPVPGSPTGAPLWVRLEPNPKTNEMVLAYLSGTVNGVGSVTNAALHLLVWNGTTFGNEQTFSPSLSTDNINLCLTCTPAIVGQFFDIAYEHLSGRAIVSWGWPGNSTPLYVIWDGSTSTWAGTSNANQAAASPGTSLIYFKMTGDPNSDRIALGTRTLDGQNYDIQLWNGSAWEIPEVISDDKYNPLYNVTPPVPTDPNFNVGRNFDLAWEKDSGKLVTVFGTESSINSCGFKLQPLFPYGTRFKTWDPTIDKTTSSPIGWSTDVLIPNVGRDLVPRSIQLVSDTSSNDIFLEVTGHPVTVYSSNNTPGNALCIVAENSAHNSDPRITHDHLYWMRNGAWVYKEEINTASSSAIQALIGLQAYTAYGQSVMAAFNADGTPPSAITDLTITGATSNSVTLQWTAPGDDGDLGKVAGYTLAWSNGSSTNTTTFLPTQFAGGTETFTITSGIASATTYSFSITSTDKAGNNSPLSSNPPSATVPSGGSTVIAPAAIQELKIVPGSLTSYYNTILKKDIWYVQLTWTAPFISASYTGTGAAYDLRWSSARITNDTAFSLANPIVVKDKTGLPLRNGLSPPQIVAGTREFFDFVDLPTGTVYFAIKTCGPLGIPPAMDPVTFLCTGDPLNISPINANSVTITSQTQCYPTILNAPCVNNGGTTGGSSGGDMTPPAPITDLTMVQNSANYNSVILSWTATGDDGTIGKATQYDIRYSELQIVDNATFNNAALVANLPVPGPSGTAEFFTVTGLKSNTQYYFAVKAIDKGGNASAVSTCPGCPIHTALYNGYNLVSVPYRLPGPNDPASVFGNDVSTPVTVYQWNGAYAVPSVITDGIGYFLYSTGQNSVLRATDSSGKLLLGTPESSPAAAPLLSGWNIVGNPYLYPIYLKDTCIKRGSGSSVPYAEAVDKGWVGNSIYSYDGTQYIAEIYSDPLNILSPALLGPWKGYWFQLLLSDMNYSLIYLNTPGACP